jgi:hypothetical protein
MRPKYCSHCGKELELSKFHPAELSENGLKIWCGYKCMNSQNPIMKKKSRLVKSRKKNVV